MIGAPGMYILDPLAKLPKRWTDKDGKSIIIMAGPVQGWLMAKRPGCIPFVLLFSELLNQHKHPHHLGPFKPAEKPKRGRS